MLVILCDRISIYKYKLRILYSILFIELTQPQAINVKLAAYIKTITRKPINQPFYQQIVFAMNLVHNLIMDDYLFKSELYLGLNIIIAIKTIALKTSSLAFLIAFSQAPPYFNYHIESNQAIFSSMEYFPFYTTQLRRICQVSE